MLAYYEALKEEFDGDLTQIAAARIENNPRHGKNWVSLVQQQDVVAIDGYVQQPAEMLCIYYIIYIQYTQTHIYICIHTCRASKFGHFSW